MNKIMTTVLTFLISIMLIAICVLLFPRLFGGKETKAMYSLNDIIYSYVEPKSENILDFFLNRFDPGTYEYKDNNLYLSIAVSTDGSIIEVLSILPAINDEIEGFIINSQVLSDEETNLNVRIEYRAEWVLELKPKLKDISIGVGDQNSLDEVLKYCKDYESIHIGGYWGYNVSVSNVINSDFFAEFTALKALEITDIETSQMERRLNEALINLRDRGVSITTHITNTPTATN